MVMRLLSLLRTSGGTLRLFLLCYLAAYVLMQMSGLFSHPAVGMIGALHRWPALAAVVLLAAASIGELSRGGDGRSRQAVLLHAGIIALAAGGLVSSAARFEGSLVLAEGQGVHASRTGGFDPAAVRAQPFASWPDETVQVLEASPRADEAGGHSLARKARVLFREGSGGREREIGPFVPAVNNGSFYRITAAGYAPHIVLFGPDGAVIDDVNLIMDLTPPGAEDLFRMPELPHTFSVRYYPDASLLQAQGGAAGGRTGPVYRVRITRNLDLVADVAASPFELIDVEGVRLSLQEMRRWVEIRIVNDPGIYPAAVGFLCLLASAWFRLKEGNEPPLKRMKE